MVGRDGSIQPQSTKLSIVTWVDGHVFITDPPWEPEISGVKIKIEMMTDRTTGTVQ